MNKIKTAYTCTVLTVAAIQTARGLYGLGKDAFDYGKAKAQQK